MTSRYKEDLGFIRDMHRLLTYKGYTFPEVRREDAAVLNTAEVGGSSLWADWVERIADGGTHSN